MQGGDRLVPRIVLAAERGGFDLVDLSIAEPSLETVFINLTGRSCGTDDHGPGSQASPGTGPADRRRPRPLGGRRQLDRARRTAAARPGGAAEALLGVRAAHAHPAVPALLRVPLRLPEDRPGHRRARHGGSSPRSRPSWCPAWSASPSCSRACSPSRWPWPRSSASPGRSRTGSRRPARSGWWPMAKVLSGAAQGMLVRGHRAADRLGRARARRAGPPDACTGG